MAFSDGWSLYAIHGCFVSERLVMHPDEVGLEDLPLDENLEVLHATIEMLGHERFLAAAKAQLMQEDDFGRLHRIQFRDYELFSSWKWSMRRPIQTEACGITF